MIQKFYRAQVMARFMKPQELAKFDQTYQSVKVPTANNLGELTFRQLVEAEVKRVLSKSRNEQN